MHHFVKFNNAERVTCYVSTEYLISTKRVLVKYAQIRHPLYKRRTMDTDGSVTTRSQNDRTKMTIVKKKRTRS